MILVSGSLLRLPPPTLFFIALDILAHACARTNELFILICQGVFMSKTDTTAGAVKAFEQAQKIHNPPEFIKLSKSEMNFWRAIMRTKAYDTWTEYDLIQAANLAISQATIQELTKDIRKEGVVIKKEGGNTTIPNPKIDAKIKETDLSIRLSRIIHVHSEATGGRAKDARGKNKSVRGAQEATKGRNSLLAGGDQIINA